MAKELKVPGEYQSRTPRSQQKIFSIRTEKVYTEYDYKAYIRVINYKISETKELLVKYEERKKISSLSFEQWVQWQKGELNLDDIKIESNDKGL